ncbi:DsbA family protein [Listeria sp. FSL L7-1582]|uniref:DsbA family protein n=1 Tax=Listeria portnoyi TaxID=2713504 RepID=UPI00164E363C|nr:DsbA family protein [Listeria portnoyi]MBC6310328.1 DsbA family protein [Listeria portnoyi]
MDISEIIASNVGTEAGIHIGKSDAPVKVISFVNVRCPFCREWHEKSRDVISRYLDSGRIELIVKPFDKEKESLQRGNVIHHYLDYAAPEQTLEILDEVYARQDLWGSLTHEEVANFAEDELGLSKQDNKEQAEKIIAEANAANIRLVPTVIIGEHIFDEHISPEELEKLILEEAGKE